MATKPRVPKFDAPVFDDLTHFSREWYQAFQQQAHTGTPATTATGGAGTLPANPVGFITVYVNGEEKRVPFYDPA